MSRDNLFVETFPARPRQPPINVDGGTSLEGRTPSPIDNREKTVNVPPVRRWNAGRYCPCGDVPPSLACEGERDVPPSLACEGCRGRAGYVSTDTSSSSRPILQTQSV